jgi:hypothetical protein
LLLVVALADLAIAIERRYRSWPGNQTQLAINLWLWFAYKSFSLWLF